METPYLPEELITIILARVPSKSVGKFRCVSKLWLSLLTSPDFIKLHLEFSSGRQQRLLSPHIDQKSPESVIVHSRPLPLKNDNDSGKIETLSFNHHHLPTRINNIVGSCNGLVCIYVGCHQLALWNPSTKESRMLPRVLKESAYYSYGFGYDSSNNDYKVVKVSFYRHKYGVYENTVEVYSLRANLWRPVDLSFRELFYSEPSGVFTYGALHWKACLNDSNNSGVIVGMNMTTENSTLIELPISVSFRSMVLVGVSNQHHLSVAYTDLVLDQMSVWAMKDYGVKRSWTKFVSIGRCCVVGCHVYVTRMELLVWGRILQSSTKGHWKEFDKNITHLESDISFDDNYYIEFGFTSYCDSLVSPQI